MSKQTIEGQVWAVAQRMANGNAVPTIVFDVTDNQQYPRRLAIEFYGKQAEKVAGVITGDSVQIDYDVTSREYNGKWYTSANGFACRVLCRAQQAEPAPVEPQPQPEAAQDDGPLPF